jgi:hypothetical protein
MFISLKQVAECGDGGEIVGVIRACVNTVRTRESSGYVKLAYILGLRVSPSHRSLSFSKKLFVLLCFPDHLHLITSLPLLD